MITEARLAPGARGVIMAERGVAKRYSMATTLGTGDGGRGWDCRRFAEGRSDPKEDNERKETH